MNPRIINFGKTALRSDLIEAIVDPPESGTLIFMLGNKSPNDFYSVPDDFQTVLMKWHASMTPENEETK